MKPRMPGEFEPHTGTIMIWPVRAGSWTNGGRGAQRVFARIASEIAKGERMWMAADAAHLAEARAALPPEVEVIEIESDDAWARDVGPTFVQTDDGRVVGIDWRFNAWGGAVDGLYADWEKDDAFAAAFCRRVGYECRAAKDFVLEGGSIHSDGEGTLIVTEACLLSKGRNPSMTKPEIEARLKAELGAEKVIWLPHGIYNDETNEHIDNVCAFVKPGKVVLAWTDDTSDPQYELSAADLAVLEREMDACGRRFEIMKLPIPARPVTVTTEELSALAFAPGEDTREPGERLAASYVNFYIANDCVLVPQFGDANDARALEILGASFPARRVVGIPAREIIIGGGNIHCITQQVPV